MNEEPVTENISLDEADQHTGILKLPLVASLVALVGLADSIYLTVKHFTAEPVPCSLTGGCETVLSSEFAEFAGIPIAAFGAVAYFIAFSLAVLTAFGDSRTWKLFGIHVFVMSLFTAWLLYVQAFILGAFCQFCLLSAATTFTMLAVFALSSFFNKKS